MEELNEAKITEDILKERQDDIEALDGVLKNCQKISNDMGQLVIEQGVKVGI